MFERFERPVKIVCLALAVLLAWQVGSVILGGDPLAHLKIPSLPTLPGATNETAKGDHKDTNAALATKAGTNATNVTVGTNVAGGTNVVKGTNMAANTNMATSTNVAAGTNPSSGTNAAKGTNLLANSTNLPNSNSTNKPNSTNAASKTKHPGSRKPGQPGMPPELMAQMMAGGMPGGMPGGRGGPGMKKMELPPEIQARVDTIIQSEIFGALPRPMPMALLGIADNLAFIQATNGQTDGVKVGGELAGIKLLRIGINRVLIETGGEKQELTIFDGIGSESLMPKPRSEPSTNSVATNAASTNAPSTNAPTKMASKRKAGASNASTNQILSSKQKENP